MRVVLKDYEISNVTVHRRDNIDLLVGSILVTASLLVLANTGTSEKLAHSMWVYALASIGLSSFWLIIMHYRSKMLNDISFYRIKAIEEAIKQPPEKATGKATDKSMTKFSYEFGIHSYNIDKTRSCDNKKPIWWLRLRRTFWGIVLFLLSLAWMLLSLT